MKLFDPFFLILFLFLVFSSCNQTKEVNQFTLLPQNDTKINFKNTIRETKEFNVFEYGYLYNGGGVSIGAVPPTSASSPASIATIVRVVAALAASAVSGATAPALLAAVVVLPLV